MGQQCIEPGPEEAMKATRTLVVEAHAAVRFVLRAILNTAAEIDLLGEVDRAGEALEKVMVLAPDVAVIDISLGQASGLELSRAIRRSQPTTRIVLLVEEQSRAYEQAAYDAGASGVVRKAAIATQLVPCIRRVASEGSIDG
jgi:DNA-binding NarL/FixJ family response regulator